MSRASRARLVVDSSVAVKWFFDEPLADAAVAVLQAGRSGSQALVVPDLIYAEFGNAVRKRVLRDGLSADDGAIIVAAFARIPFETVLATRRLLPSAYRIALQFGCTVYDAVYLAAARQAGSEVVTADERLSRTVGDRFAGLRLLE